MPIDDVVVSAEHCLRRSLEPIEKLILQASWQGQPYNVIAETSGYANVYVREVGARLWQELSEALGTKVTKKTLSLVMDATVLQPSSQLIYPSGPLPLDSPLYIDRPELMRQAQIALGQPGCLIRIQGARATGKTSYLFRLLDWSKAQDYRSVSLNLRQLEPSATESFATLAQWLLLAIASELGFSPQSLQSETEAIATPLQLSRALRQILTQLDQPLVLALRDLDTVLPFPSLATSLCALLRGWQEEAQRDSAWGKLRLLVSYTHDLDPAGQAGLPWGLEQRLEPLDFAQATKLAQAYGWIPSTKEVIDESTKANLQQLMAWVGGHPFLLAIAFYHLGNHLSLSELMANSTSSNRIFGSHLRSYLGWLQEQPELAVALRTVVSARGPVSLPVQPGSALESAGLIRLQDSQAQPSCELYRQYFAQQLRSVGAMPMPTLEISDLQRLEARLDSLSQQIQTFQQFSYLDRLTQFTSQQFFEQRVQQACEQANGDRTSLALLLCSFDHYDVYVKSYGYLQAENVLRQVADCLRECVEGPLENFSRYGSEQFLVVLPNYSLDQVITMADRLRERVENLAIPQSIGYMGWSQVVTVSIGVAGKQPRNAIAAAYLLATAEKALAQAQRQGNNCIDVKDCPSKPGTSPEDPAQP